MIKLKMLIAAIVICCLNFESKALEVVKVPLSQSHIKAYNNITRVTTVTDWWFVINPETQTATVTYPRTAEGETMQEPFDATNVYKFSFPGWQGLYNQAMYNCWSTILDSIAPNAPMFYTALKVPESFTYNGIRYTVDKIGDNALNGCNAQYINVPESITEIGDYAFANSTIIGLCEASPYSIVPNSVVKLGKGAFKNCAKLSRVEIGDGVTEILEETFDGCSAALQIRFGKNVSDIACDISATRVAFSSPTAPTVKEETFDAFEVWVPQEYAANYAAFSPSEYSIVTDTTEIVAYPKQPRRINFVQKSALYNMNRVYSYIYYYPSKPYKVDERYVYYNFTTNALVGRGACKVQFTMDFDDLSKVYEGHQVYEYYNTSLKQCNSYSVVAFDSVGEYTVSYTALDITRASGSKKVRVIEGVYVAEITIDGDTIVAENDSLALKATPLGPDNDVPTCTGLIWSSEDTSIATVDSISGVVFGKKPGVTYIRATSTDSLCLTTHGRHLMIVVAEPEAAEPQSRAMKGGIAESLNNGNAVSVEAADGMITVRNLAEGAVAEIYTSDGKLFNKVRSSGNDISVSAPTGRIYIVVAGDTTVKVKP